MLSEVFGSTAVRLVKMAQGDDPTQVIPFQKVPKLSLEHRLDRDEIDRERVEAVLFQQVEEAGWMLRRHNEIPGKLGLEIHYADGAVAGNQLSLPPLTFPTDRSLFHVALSLFRKLFQRRVATRSLVLEFSDFSAPFRQMPLFPWEKTAAPGCNQNLQRALDGIRERYGRTSVAWGLTLLAGSSPKATLRTP
jgi:DNA polymerase-4